jgi:hypothetical protein
LSSSKSKTLRRARDMSRQVTLLLPKEVMDALEKRAERMKITLEELILRAVVRIIEEEMKR